MIITIDGPAGSGKSSVARAVADALGFTFFDTGAMYRAVTLGLLRSDIDVQDKTAVEAFVRDFALDVRLKDGEKRYYWNDEDITDAIRSHEVNEHVSPVATMGCVRDRLVQLQRKMAQGVDSVFEGRDMGSVVFPAADLKIFLIASPLVRAQRRLQQLQQQGLATADDSVEKIAQQIARRDSIDSSRELAPLIKPEGAIEIDTSDLSLKEVEQRILDLAS